ncbi:organic cation transporter protein-like [Maniola jurtina]|uniref:organic cation transporter protein-like n=1 Tax=Maniola jurtina TaxID=191418 RepID=UPI001E68B1A2|nr:organic cation transporter protein-like [Maniola jurtina]
MDVKEELNKKEHADSDVLEKVLMHVGELGRYQKLLFLAMAPFGVFFAFVYFVQMFITATPQRHWCRVPELEHLDVELRRNLTAPPMGEEWERCLMYDANWTHVLQNNSVLADTPTVPCRNGWEFELGDIPYETVVSERGWVCEYAGYTPFAQTIFFAGSFVGGIYFGWMADHFGRVPALVGTNLFAFIGGVASIYTTGIWDFAFCRFLVGMSYDSCFMLMYILVLEYVGPRYRTWVANLSIALYFGGGCLILPWLALWIGDWRNLLWATSVPFLLVIIVPFTVPESARWLSSRGRVNDAVKVIRRFEKVNGTKVPDDVMDEFIVSASQTRQTNESIKDVFKSGPLRKMMLIMVVVYMACAAIFDGLVRMSEGLGFDFFITFTLTSATEIPSVTLLAFVLDKWGRRILTCGPMFTSGVLILIAAFVPKGIPQVTLAIMARFLINMSYNAAIQWSAELLPTPVRASGSSLIHVSGYVATLVSPYIVYSERVWRSLPLLILGLIAMVGSSVSLLLPETNGMQMPQTIEEGEKIVSSYTLCGKAEDVEVDSPEENDKLKALIT